MLKLETRADLQRLIADEIPESLTLDYKASPSLGKDSKQRDELCKDVSAFANSAGGQIIYGIEEKDHKPVKIDSGSSLPREWIEQVIDSNIQQRIEGLTIAPIPVGDGNYAYVVEIPQALARAPHQAPDKKYYKRQNFQSVPMEDYEVRDALRRATTPDLFITLSFANGDRMHINYDPREELSRPVMLLSSIGNRSAQPAHYTLIKIGIADEITVPGSGPNWAGFHRAADENGDWMTWLSRRIASPPDFPIFKEFAQSLDASGIPLVFHSGLLSRTHRFPIRIAIHTPGFASNETWFIQQQGADLRLLHPGHPLLR